MKVHLFSTGSVVTPGWLMGHLGEHHFHAVCALIEHPSRGLSLVDVGFGSIQLVRGQRPPDRIAATLARVRVKASEIAKNRVIELGFDPHEVRRIIVTHMHWDHVDGLCDFPRAEVIVHAKERAHACTFFTPAGYDRFQYFDVKNWRPIRFRRKGRLGFPRSHDLFGDDSLLLIELPGHSPGHMGVLLPHSNPQVFLTGDAFYEEEELERPEWRPYSWLNAVSPEDRLRTLERLKVARRMHPDLLLLGSHSTRPPSGWDRALTVTRMAEDE